MLLVACAAPPPDDVARDALPEAPDPEIPSDTDTSGPVDAVPEEAGDLWRFTSGQLLLEIDPSVGARVTTLTWAGVPLLTDETVDPLNYGATFWTSPQSDWGWPPPAALDTAPWAAAARGDTLVLTSGDVSVGGGTVTVEKAISVADSIVTQTYTLRNVGTADVALAGWQVARVPAGGLTVFPVGEGISRTVGTLPYVEIGGSVWLAETPDADAKAVADGTGGWLAEVTRGVLLVTRAEDVPAADAAPGEGEIEIYARGGGGYVEIERQSAFSTIEPGKAREWRVTWSVATVPADVEVAVGSATLVAFIDGLP